MLPTTTSTLRGSTVASSRLDATMARTILTLLTLLIVPAAVHAQSTWVKLCENANAIIQDKDGDDRKRNVDICMTHHERLDENGNLLFSAALRQIEGQDKQHFMVMVPLGMLIKPGMRATIYSKDLWESTQTNQGIKESDEVQSLTLAYTLCHPAGCTAEVEATPELLARLKNSAGVMITSTRESGASVAFSIPLNGFAQALEGEPFDARKPRRPLTPMRCDQGFWRGCTLPPEIWGTYK
jgi:invasion protein IalB